MRLIIGCLFAVLTATAPTRISRTGLWKSGVLVLAGIATTLGSLGACAAGSDQ
jgi:hypothetical protein